MNAATIRLNCPVCGRAVRGCEPTAAATQVRRRTCICGNRWIVTIAPIRIEDDRRFDKIEWNPIGRVAVSRAELAHERRRLTRMATKEAGR